LCENYFLLFVCPLNRHCAQIGDNAITLHTVDVVAILGHVRCSNLAYKTIFRSLDFIFLKVLYSRPTTWQCGFTLILMKSLHLVHKECMCHDLCVVWHITMLMYRAAQKRKPLPNHQKIVLIIIIIIIRNLYSVIMPLGGYRGAEFAYAINREIL